MNLLLDTHAFIWFLQGDNQLPVPIRNIIADTGNKCFVSIGSIWEIAIKSSLGKLTLEGAFSEISGFIHENEMEVLPITFEHLQILLGLPFHHRDPFDRVIIAQALAEDLKLISKDQMFKDYQVPILWD